MINVSKYAAKARIYFNEKNKVKKLQQGELLKSQRDVYKKPLKKDNRIITNRKHTKSNINTFSTKRPSLSNEKIITCNA